MMQTQSDVTEIGLEVVYLTYLYAHLLWNTLRNDAETA